MGLVFDKVSYFDDVKDVTFCVNDGKITGIIGDDDNTLKKIYDLLLYNIFPTKGNIIGNYSKIGCVSYELDDHFFYDSIGENLFFVLKLNHFNNIAKRINDSLKMVGLDKTYIEKNVHLLSSSEQRKICIALSLCINPDFVVLFDPLNGLNKSDYDYFVRLILMMKNKYNRTIVIISQNSDFVFNLCDDVVLMKDGKVLKYGEKFDVFTDKKISGVCCPKTVEFSRCVLENKNINIGYRSDINDLIKDIFRFVR